MQGWTAAAGMTNTTIVSNARGADVFVRQHNGIRHHQNQSRNLHVQTVDRMGVIRSGILHGVLVATEVTSVHGVYLDTEIQQPKMSGQIQTHRTSRLGVYGAKATLDHVFDQ